MEKKGSNEYICVVGAGYPSKKYVRNGIFEWDWASALAYVGVNVVYVALDLRSIRRKRKWGIEHLVKDGIDIYAINIPVGAMPNEICEIIGAIGFKILYKRIEKEHGRPAIIHSHFLTTSVMVSSVCKKEKIPFVLTEHSSSLDKALLSKSDYIRAVRTYKNAVARIAVSNSFCRNLKQATGADFTVIHNMVNLDDFQYADKQSSEEFTFAVTANFIPVKNHVLLLNAFKVLHERYSDTRLLMFGDGAERSKVKKQIENLKLSDSVTLFGNIERKRIGKEYRKVDVFVLPSEHETFGVAYIEAMAAGIPVIATKCGGPEDFVMPSNGILIDVGDVVGLTNAMEYMLLHKDGYDRKAISEYARVNFSPEHIAKEIIKVYKSVV